MHDNAVFNVAANKPYCWGAQLFVLSGAGSNSVLFTLLATKLVSMAAASLTTMIQWFATYVTPEQPRPQSLPGRSHVRPTRAQPSSTAQHKALIGQSLFLLPNPPPADPTCRAAWSEAGQAGVLLLVAGHQLLHPAVRVSALFASPLKGV